MFVLQQIGKRQVTDVDLLMESIVALLFIVIGVALVVRAVRRARSRKVLEQLLETDQQSGQALVRYVQLNRQCSEEEAYQRLATFVKRHRPFDDHDYIDKMVASDRQGLLERARSLLIDDPDEIDKV